MDFSETHIHKHKTNRGNRKGQMDDRGLVLRGSMYPFGLDPCWSVLDIAGRRVSEINLYIIRHFFEKVGRNQALVPVQLTLQSTRSRISRVQSPTTGLFSAVSAHQQTRLFCYRREFSLHTRKKAVRSSGDLDFSTFPGDLWRSSEPSPQPLVHRHANRLELT